MKQILQNLATGKTLITNIPSPIAGHGNILVHTKVSLLSAGTERMLIEFGKASYLEKARQQPEKVKMVMSKVATDGLVSTFESVQSKLNQPLQLGYSNVGVVAEVGAGVKGFKVGDRVLTNGPHAEVVRIPKNLCAKIPDSVDDESAVFTVLASIGLQGVRLAQPTLGEYFVVIGAGLIGLLTIQLLIANGCRVMAIDYDCSKLSLAKQFGAQICNLSLEEDPVAFANLFSRGQGVDGVIITASTNSKEPLTQAAHMCRKRGRVILVGVAKIELNRADFYEKELTFQVSCSYGPGRYDSNYEENGQDYPLGYVRWTEQRNFEAVLDMLDIGKLNVKPLISHRFIFEDAVKAYELLIGDEPSLGILLQYKNSHENRITRQVQLQNNFIYKQGRPVFGFIGAGNYGSRVLIPAFKSSNVNLKSIVTVNGVSGAVHGAKAGFAQASTDINSIFNDSLIDSVVIATRHDTHADLVVRSIQSGKHVFVEKPLAINFEGLNKVENAYKAAHLAGLKGPQLMVGFNRRFSPHIEKMKNLLATVIEPKCFLITVNAGFISADHWLQDYTVGGGRIVGEACHFIDLMRFLAESPILSVQARCIRDGSMTAEDKASITIYFEDGSFGTIMYLANGAPTFPKERVEVFCAGRVLQLDNFRRLRGYGWTNFAKKNLWRQDKGQNTCVAMFLQSIETGIPAIPAHEIFEVTRVSIQIAELLRKQI